VTPQEQSPTVICPGSPSLQHLWPTNHRLQKASMCWRSGNYACWWRLAGSGRGAKQGQDIATIGEHLQTLKWLRKQLTSCVALLRQFAASGWGVGATTLWTAFLDLVHSTADKCTPVQFRSANTHLINPVINYALRIVTGCLRLAPAAGHTMEWNVNLPSSIAGKMFHTIPFHTWNLPYHTKNRPCHLPYFSIPSVKIMPYSNTSDNKRNGADPH